MKIERFTAQVLHNCDVSDARHAGIYSVCGLAMRLRDLYKWEHRLLPWQEDEPAKVLDWIGRKEDVWEPLMEADYVPLELEGRTMDPFDVSGINRLLAHRELYYGAGYAHSLKPTFFLADIADHQEVAGHRIWILGKEHARDLLTLPAFSQDGQAVLRAEASRMFLWDQIAYMNNAGRRALDFAMYASGLPDNRMETAKAHFDTLWTVQKTIYIHHELGELEETVFDRDVWQAMLADFPHTAVELLIRTLKDLLADTGPHGALTHLVRGRNSAALGLYMAFGKGLTPLLCAELICAFDAFLDDRDWTRIEAAAGRVRTSIAGYTADVVRLYSGIRETRGVEFCRTAIEKDMVRRGLLPPPQRSADPAH